MLVKWMSKLDIHFINSTITTMYVLCLLLQGWCCCYFLVGSTDRHRVHGVPRGVLLRQVNAWVLVRRQGMRQLHDAADTRSV